MTAVAVPTVQQLSMITCSHHIFLFSATVEALRHLKNVKHVELMRNMPICAWELQSHDVNTIVYSCADTHSVVVPVVFIKSP